MKCCCLGPADSPARRSLVVQVWDTRNLGAAVCELVVEDGADMHPSHVVSSIGARRSIRSASWCPSRAGLLAGAIRDECTIMLWDAFRPSQEPQVVTTAEPVSAFAWERAGTSAGPLKSTTVSDDHEVGGLAVTTAPSAGSTASVLEVALVVPVRERNDFCWNRVMAVSQRKSAIEDVSVIPSKCIDVSPHGEIAISCGVGFHVLPAADGTSVCTWYLTAGLAPHVPGVRSLVRFR
jgi:hypothetical protein